MTAPDPKPPELREEDANLLRTLRRARRRERLTKSPTGPARFTTGQRVADIVAAGMGSWRFIIIQTSILIVWIALNITAWVRVWDPVSLHPPEPGPLLPGRLRRPLHHDEPESPGRR